MKKIISFIFFLIISVNTFAGIPEKNKNQFNKVNLQFDLNEKANLKKESEKMRCFACWYTNDGQLVGCVVIMCPLY